MSKVWKCLVPFGRYLAPNREGESVVVRVDVRRAKHWKRAFDRLTAMGYKVPVPWGHRVESIPVSKVFLSSLSSDTETDLTRHNATYLDEVQIRKDGLWVSFEPPPGYRYDAKTGVLSSVSDHTSVRDISVGLGNLIDGQGRLHEDIILHAALCTYPIAPSGGFRIALSTARQSSGPSTARFACALSISMREKSVAKDSDEVVEEIASTETPDDTDGLDDGDQLDDMPDAGLEETMDASEPVGEESEEIEVQPMDDGNGSPEFVETVQLLRQLGLDLPETTAEKDFFKSMCVALRTALSMGAKFAKPGDNPDGQTTKMASSQLDTTGESNITAETPPILMSAASIKDPLIKKLVQKEEKRLKGELTRTWQEIVAMGCPGHIATRESAKVQSVTLSLNAATGNLKTPAALHLARLVKEILQGMGGSPAAQLKKTLSTATVVAPKDVSSRDTDTPSLKSNATDVKPDPDNPIDAAMRRGAGIPPKK